MGHETPCEGCGQAHNCAAVYQRLGHTGGSSVASKVIIAFALPIVAFVAALATFDHLLSGAVAEQYRTLAAFALALTCTVGLMLVVSALVKRSHRKD
jgi:Kef-type K+ transport system membrane component KefB